MSFVYTTLASDSFHRANENPVNPAVWSAGSLGVTTPCQIVGNELEPVDAAGSAFYTGITWPANQWAEVQVDACQFSDNNDYASVILTLNTTMADDSYYAFEVDGPLGAECNVSIFSQSGSGYTLYLGTAPGGPGTGDAIIPLFAGDTIRMELFNNFLSGYVIHSGVSTQVLAPVQGNVVAQAGLPGIVLYEDTQASDAQVSNFGGGLISGQNAYSVPDSRVKPNASRNVQGTLIYDVQTSSNPNIPPTDSRVSKPVDSRLSAPQNSRTSPPFSS
jgi:hypothetical protein